MVKKTFKSVSLALIKKKMFEWGKKNTHFHSWICLQWSKASSLGKLIIFNQWLFVSKTQYIGMF